MLRNNNGAVITRMATHSLVRNKGRNIVLILAVMLSSFMLFTVLTVGGTWIRMLKLEMLRTQGGEFEAVLYGFTREQEEICQSHPEIKAVGIGAYSGWGIKTEQDDTLHSIFVWADKTQWETILKPARKWVKGSYPQKANEVMVTREVLKDCGMEQLNVGDSFTITYGDNLGEHTRELVISGMWGGYGDKKTFYVSKEFFEQSGFMLQDNAIGLLHLQLKSGIITNKLFERLEKDLKVDKKQRLIPSSTAQTDMVYVLLGVLGLIAVICLSAYLLIYNILYLSVSGNIRYYGLLQTIGMTPKQIYQLVKKQMWLIGAMGIGMGLVLGIVTSFGLIPAIVKGLGIHEKHIEIVFHPFIFLLSILFTVATVKIGSRKPARLATLSSPIEALGYRKVSLKKQTRKPAKGGLLWRMAKERIGRDKKKTAMVVASLGISLSVFLCMVTLIESQGPRTIVSNYMESDMIINNDTMQMREKNEWKPLIDTSFLENIKEDEAIKKVYPVYNEEIVIPWQAEFIDYWMTNFYDMWMQEAYDDVKEDYQKHPEKYYSFLVGIDKDAFRYLNFTMENTVAEKDFLEGKACILYDNMLGLDFEKVNGQKISYYLKDNPKQRYQMTMQGITNDTHYANLLGTPPTLIVSSTFLKEITKNPYISKVGIEYEREYDEEAEDKIKDLMDDSSYKKDFSYSSKIEEVKTVEKAQGNMMRIGIGLALLLAFIGIMNYVNTSVSNLQASQMELSVMESIGMTQKQLQKLLVREGVLYAVSALLFAATIGLFITYCLYQSMNYRQIPFEVPVLPVLAAVFMVLLLCIVVPLLAYWRLERKETLVERIRGVE